MLSIRASVVGKVVAAATVATTLGFAVAFMLVLDKVFGALSSAGNFFKSANVLMYITIEGMFLCGIIAAGLYVASRYRAN